MKKSHLKASQKENIIGTLLASIPVIGFILFGIIPMVISLFMSFSDVPTFSISDMKLYSFKEMFTNYSFVLKDPLFYKSIGNTFYALLSLPLAIIIGLVLAVLLNQNLKGKKIYRTLYFLPYVCSIVAITLMWRTLLDKNYGVINQFLGIFNVEPVAWLTNEKTFMPAMIVMSVWCGVGFNMILYSAALSNINPSYYEAAEIDGANKFQKFFKITVPLLSSTTFYLLVVGLIGGLQEFTRFQAINSVNSNLISPTGPDNAGLTIVFYLYNKAFLTNGGLGIAVATSWLLAILTTIITIINFKFSKRWVYDG